MGELFKLVVLYLGDALEIYVCVQLDKVPPLQEKFKWLDYK